MSNPYKACLHPVPGRGVPPVAFLDQILDTIGKLPNDVFAPNAREDIYSRMVNALGPYRDTKHRRAVMCEVLRVLAGEESGWVWNCGADSTAGHETPTEVETGAFQVSANSLGFDLSLRFCFSSLTGNAVAISSAKVDTSAFIAAMKSNHWLAVEYCARLLRFSIKWDGPIERGVVAAHVSRAAVAEFESFLP